MDRQKPNKTIIEQVNEVYQDFLYRAKQVEIDRDERIAALIGRHDEEQIKQILNDIRSRSNGS